MKKIEFIKFLDTTTSFIKGGIFDYFEEIDIENSTTIYLSIDDEIVTIYINDCKYSLSFDEFIEKYNNVELNNWN